MQVAFPMYVLPEMQADMRSLWVLLRSKLAAAGVENLPHEPRFDDPLAQGSLPADMLMLQYCGFPYVTEWREAMQPLACLHYDAPHCEGKTHRSVIVVRADDDAKTIKDLRGKRAAINGYDSNTGMNLLRHAVADVAQDGTFFGEVIVTGAHVDSLRAVAEGRADVAAIDCVTFAFIGDYQPALTAAVRVLAVTAPSPALPLFVPANTPLALREQLYGAWKAVLDERHLAEDLLTRLRMRAIEPVTDDELDSIAHYAQDAAARGYPVLR